MKKAKQLYERFVKALKQLMVQNSQKITTQMSHATRNSHAHSNEYLAKEQEENEEQLKTEKDNVVFQGPLQCAMYDYFTKIHSKTRPLYPRGRIINFFRIECSFQVPQKGKLIFQKNIVYVCKIFPLILQAKVSDNIDKKRSKLLKICRNIERKITNSVMGIIRVV